MTQLPAKIYDENDIARARRKGQVVGWLQAAGVVILIGIVLNVLGWIPTIVVTGLVGFVLYKLLFGKSKDEKKD